MRTTTSSPLHGGSWVTDGGLETDLLFHHGVDLPEFAAFPLLETVTGRALLERYYADYVAIARKVGGETGLVLDTATWRANPDWGAKVGYDAAGLRTANHAAVALVHRVRDELAGDLPAVLVNGAIGPRGDGYVDGGRVDPAEAAAYHQPQVRALADAGADLVTALTMTGTGEALGVVLAARSVGVPVGISFTLETDGRLPDGTSLPDAIRAMEETAPADHYQVNCAHPTHVLPGLGENGDSDGGWRQLILGTRVNASTLSHAELDEAEELDEGDLDLLVSTQDALRPLLPNLTLVGGCCGTDSRHVAALWGVG